MSANPQIDEAKINKFLQIYSIMQMLENKGVSEEFFIPKNELKIILSEIEACDIAKNKSILAEHEAYYEEEKKRKADDLAMSVEDLSLMQANPKDVFKAINEATPAPPLNKKRKIKKNPNLIVPLKPEVVYIEVEPDEPEPEPEYPKIGTSEEDTMRKEFERIEILSQVEKGSEVVRTNPKEVLEKYPTLSNKLLYSLLLGASGNYNAEEYKLFRNHLVNVYYRLQTFGKKHLMTKLGLSKDRTLSIRKDLNKIAYYRYTIDSYIYFNVHNLYNMYYDEFGNLRDEPKIFGWV